MSPHDVGSAIAIVAMLIAASGGMVVLFGGPHPNGWLRSVRRLPVERVLSRMESTAGFRFVERTLPARAAVGRFELQVDYEPRAATLEMRVETDGALPRQLEVRFEGLIQSDDFQTGDAAFDRRHRLSGPPAVLAAVMDREVRRLFTTLDQWGSVSVHQGAVVFGVTVASPTPEQLGRRSLLLIELAERLCVRAEDLPPRLATVVEDGEESDALRALAMEQLLARAPTSPEAQGAVDHAFEARHTGLLLAAARRIGGRDPRLRGAALSAATRGPATQRLQALDVLAKVATADEREPLSRIARAPGQPEAVRAAAKTPK